MSSHPLHGHAGREVSSNSYVRRIRGWPARLKESDSFKTSAWFFSVGAEDGYIPHPKSPSLRESILEGLGGGLGGGEGGSPLDIFLSEPMVRTVINRLPARSEA